MATPPTLSHRSPSPSPEVAREQGAPSRPRPVGRRAEAREHAICDATLELLVEVGYDRLSMDALAERAKASKATIYRHWTGKAEVVAEALRCRAQPRREVVELGDLRMELLSLLATSCDALMADGPLVAAVLWAMRSDPVLADLIRRNIVQEKDVEIAGVVRRAAERGEVVRSDPGLVADVISAVALQRMLVTGEPLDEAFRIRLVDEVVIPMLRAVPAGAHPGAPPDAAPGDNRKTRRP